MIRTGAIVDASITDSLCRPRGKNQYDTLVEDKHEDDCNDKPTCVSLQQKYSSRVDIEEGWTIKSPIFFVMVTSNIQQ